VRILITAMTISLIANSIAWICLLYEYITSPLPFASFSIYVVACGIAQASIVCVFGMVADLYKRRKKQCVE